MSPTTPSTSDSLPTPQAEIAPAPDPRRRRNFQIPFVVLPDEPVLTDALAARLAASLLNHVLFLKSQIPLCVPAVPPRPPTAISR